MLCHTCDAKLYGLDGKDRITVRETEEFNFCSWLCVAKFAIRMVEKIK